MWSPTHIQVTVQKAKGLLTKGKNGTNNCFVTIGLGKEKYQTSVKEKAETNVNWNEECELKIPDQGNRAELVLTCLHRNNLGIDEFLGQVTLPLNEMDVYDRPRSKWFKLESKPGKEKKNKERGELEIRISFVVKSGSLTDLSKKDKHKSSIGQLASSVGGSLLSIGTIEKRKGIKKFAKSLGSKMHLSSKKKNKEGDDLSFSGSLASVGTPESSNGGSRRYGQRAGEADPGVISEDEDEFVFDNLSHKSSGSSLNIRSKGLQPPNQNFVPRVPSPLLAGNGKIGGKQESREVEKEKPHDIIVDEGELEEIENDFSVRARTLPPPSKPPRTQQQLANEQAALAEGKQPSLNEWETKLYGNKLDAGRSDSLKRRSWETARVPLPSDKQHEQKEKKEDTKVEEKEVATSKANAHSFTDSSASSSDSDDEEEEENVPEPVKEVKMEINLDSPKKPQLQLELDDSTKVELRNSLLSPEAGKNNFNQFNASFAKFEQRNSAKIFNLDEEENKWNSQALIDNESQKVTEVPKALPRISRENNAIDLKKLEDDQKLQNELKRQEELKLQEEQRLREEQRRKEDEKLEAELKLNEQRLREEEAQFQEESRLQEEQKKREAKRFEEDQRLLNFAKRSNSVEESDEGFTTPPSSQQQSPKEKQSGNDKKEKRFNKFKYFTKRDDSSSKSSPKSNERIIIGHEKSATHAERRSEITAALAKKYEGKSREELMLIANGMENEALLQRQRVKELEDYLDNLLLRVMETHPKILQNPYSRTTSAKSG